MAAQACRSRGACGISGLTRIEGGSRDAHLLDEGRALLRVGQEAGEVLQQSGAHRSGGRFFAPFQACGVIQFSRRYIP